MSRYAPIFALALTIGLVSCGKPEESTSVVQTDLGLSGNSTVASKFSTYKKRRGEIRGCNGTTSHPRVIVTGFGLFSGVDSNISGSITNSMSTSKFWKSKTTLSEVKASDTGGFYYRGSVHEWYSGAYSKVRTLEINGSKYEVCFLTLDVIWDLAAAIIVYESRSFDPELVIMSGLNGGDNYGVTLEGGAINKASLNSASFASSGARESSISARSNYVLDPNTSGVQKTVGLSWNNSNLGAAIKEATSEIGSFTVRTPSSARPSNDYICNNVSYVVQSAANGVEIELAGGEIRFAGQSSKAKIGFLHYPNK
jgi:hypothetical protein